MRTYAALLFAPLLSAQTLTLEPSADNVLFSESMAALSNGAGPHLFVGEIATGEARRSLLRFDFSELPPGAIVESAVLELAMTRTVAGPTNIRLHRVERDWGEGDSNSGDPGGNGAPAQPGDATWASAFHPDQPWSNQGGDFDASASALATVDGTGPYSWSSDEMAADVQAWINDPGTNFGWIMVGQENTGQRNAKRFSSRHAADGAPRLILRGTGFNPPPPPPPPPIAVPTLGYAGLGLLALGALLGARRRLRS